MSDVINTLHKAYQLGSFKDVFDQVTTDKITECMGGITRLLLASAAQRDLLLAINAEVNQGRVLGIEFPDKVEWVDDGCNDASSTVTFGEGIQVGLTFRGKKEMQ